MPALRAFVGGQAAERRRSFLPAFFSSAPSPPKIRPKFALKALGGAGTLPCPQGGHTAPYQASIDQTIETAKEATAEIEANASSEEKEDEGFLSGILSAVTDGVSNVISGITEKAGELVNSFIEALAVMLVTCCVIPILVLLSFVWFAKILLAVDIPVHYGRIHSNLKGKVFGKKKHSQEI